jgi:hypothetical protein
VPGYMIARNPKAPLPQLSSCLKESGQIRLSLNGEVVRPLGIACLSNGDLFVSLHSSHEILHLDYSGKLIERIHSGNGHGQPAQLAVDLNGRLWISDVQNRTIQRYSPADKSFKTFDGTGSRAGTFISPFALCARPNGSMLFIDGSRRVIRITPDENIEIFYEKSGRGITELLEPISICNSTKDGIWIADRRKHRLAKFSDEAALIGSFGKCGIREDELIMPEAAAEFEDGIIAVAQYGCERSIKLFDASGVAKGKILETYYVPSLLVFREKLYVTDMSYGLIRIFERTNI